MGETGSLCEFQGSQCSIFTKNCVSEAEGGDLLAQRNPTCNSAHYAGGLRCCHHGRIMLDNAQREESLNRDVLRYHLKIRFWFQEYSVVNGKPSHYNLQRIYHQTENHAGEYDVPPAFPKKDLPIIGYEGCPLNKPTPGTTCTGNCPDGPDCECVHTITSRWRMNNVRLIYAGGHCHAPSCLNMTLYQNVSGQLKLLCAQVPKYGNGSFPEDKFDELGYLLIPPCLWGDFEGDQGLEASVWLGPGSQLVSIKHNRNTQIGHFGEMASWQMRGVSFPANSTLLI